MNDDAYRDLTPTEVAFVAKRLGSLVDRGHYLNGPLVIAKTVEPGPYVNIYDLREVGRKAIGIRAAARRLKVSTDRIRGLINAGELPGFRTLQSDGEKYWWYAYKDAIEKLQAQLKLR